MINDEQLIPTLIVNRAKDSGTQMKNENVSKTRRTIYTVSILFAISTIKFVFKSDPISQLLLMPLTLGMFIMFFFAIIEIFYSWKQYRWRSFTPLVVFCILLVLPGIGAHTVRDAYFSYKISYLEDTIESYKTSGVLNDISWLGDNSPLVISQSDSVTLISFAWDSGFPARGHSLVYCDAESFEPIQKQYEWRSQYAIQDNWYVVSR